MLNNITTLKSRLGGHSRSLEMTPFDRSHTNSYWCSTVTMGLSCIISKIKQDAGRKSWFFIPHLHSMPLLRGPCRMIAITFGT